MNNSAQINNYLEQMGFQTIDNAYDKKRGVYLKSSEAIINDINKELILNMNSRYDKYNDKRFFVTKYSDNEIDLFYKKYKNKIHAFQNKEDWYWQPVILQIIDLLKYTDFKNEHYINYPNEWIDEKQLLKWLIDRDKKNLPNRLIEIKYNNEGMEGGDNKEYVGEYIIRENTKEIKLKMTFKLTWAGINSKYGIGIQYVCEIEPICNFMLGWTVKQVREYCTLNKFELERIKVLETMPYHGD